MSKQPEILYRTSEEIREVYEDFPSKKARVKELIRLKKIIVTDEQMTSDKSL
jgi:hypothetical protein